MAKWIFNVLETVPGTLDDYLKLAEYHYRTEAVAPVTNIYKIRARKPACDAFPDPLAVIVYRMPIPCLRARDKATNGYFRQATTRSERLKSVNRNVRYIARLVTDPRFRRLGIATKLLNETLPLQTAPIVETLTPIDWTNKIFQKAGFKLHHIEAPVWYGRFTQFLASIGLTDWNVLLPSTLQKRLDSLQNTEKLAAKKNIRAFIKHFRHRKDMPPGLERCRFLLSKIPFPEAYLIWYNPQYGTNQNLKRD